MGVELDQRELGGVLEVGLTIGVDVVQRRVVGLDRAIAERGQDGVEPGVVLERGPGNRVSSSS